jgi:hypothetical protein
MREGGQKRRNSRRRRRRRRESMVYGHVLLGVLGS